MPINISVEGTYVNHLFNKFGNKYGFIASIKTAGFIYGEIFDKIGSTSNPESIDQFGQMVFQNNNRPGCILNYRIKNEYDLTSLTPNKQGLSLVLEPIPYVQYNQMDLPKVCKRSYIYIDIKNLYLLKIIHVYFCILENLKIWKIIKNE
jgi:hypothetical protein